MSKKNKAPEINKLSDNKNNPGNSTLSNERLNEIQKKLKESEQLFKATLESISDPVFITDDKGNFTFICSNTEHSLEYTTEELWEMQNLYKLIGTDHFELTELKEKHHLDNIEITINTKSGKILYFLMNVKIVEIKNGTILFTLRNITGSKLIEQELKENQQLLKDTLKATTEGIWYWDFKKDELEFSPSYYSMLGYQDKEFASTYENWVKLIHPDDKVTAMKIAENWLKTKQGPYKNQFRLKHKSGDYLWVRSSGNIISHDENGVPLLMIGSQENITKRKEQELELIRNKEFYESLIEGVQDGIWVTDKQDVIFFCNSEMEKIAGIPKIRSLVTMY